MKLNLVTTSALCLLSSLFMATPFSGAIAENPPATTYQSGFWQPVADFDATKKVTITLVNQTTIPLEYGVAGNEEEPSEKIEAGQTGTVENVKNSSNIAIYPSVPVDPDKPFVLKFKVTVEPKTNTINVNIVKAESGFMGHRSINLQDTGKVYLY
jgi:hypothetical protein